MKTRERKRGNRENANRNDYGNEGFLLCMCSLVGKCNFDMKRPQKQGKNQKLFIQRITVDGTVIIDRTQLERKLDEKIQASGLSTECNNRTKKLILSITIDNELLDFIESINGFEIKDSVMKKSERSYIPDRRTILSAKINGTEFTKSQVVDQGVQFYDNWKKLEYGKSDEISVPQAEQQIVQQSCMVYPLQYPITPQQQMYVSYSQDGFSNMMYPDFAYQPNGFIQNNAIIPM